MGKPTPPTPKWYESLGTMALLPVYAVGGLCWLIDRAFHETD